MDHAMRADTLRHIKERQDVLNHLEHWRTITRDRVDRGASAESTKEAFDRVFHYEYMFAIMHDKGE